MNWTLRSGLAAAIAATSLTAQAATLTPLTSFGGGDGWRAPSEVLAGDSAATADGSGYLYLRNGNLERGLAYNPITNNLILVSRSSAGQGIRVLDGTTGDDVGRVEQTGTPPSGGTFAINMVDVGSDGAIYVGNLSTAANSNFKVYRWASEGAAGYTVAYDGLTGLARTGDSFAAIGAGSSTKIAAAGTNNVAASNFAVLSTNDGLAFAAQAYTSVPGTLTTSNDYRLGLTFVDSDTLIGNQGASARVTDFGASATVTDTIPLGIAQRPLDYAVVGGVPVLAVIDTNSARVEVFNVTNPGSPVLLGFANATSGPLTANGNAAGAVAWGAISGDTATLYAMSTNMGIQAFTFQVPEPGAVGLALVAAAAVVGLRRRTA
ncbi:MAG: hypothetical protein KF688_10530 [Pirellulales bacterium]|nr:hypothetical protein [Pirellulales bacterium]